MSLRANRREAAGRAGAFSFPGVRVVHSFGIVRLKIDPSVATAGHLRERPCALGREEQAAAAGSGRPGPRGPGASVILLTGGGGRTGARPLAVSRLAAKKLERG